MAKKVTFKVGKEVYDIPVEQADDFRKAAPDAIEVKSYVVDKDTFDIPLDKVNDFLSAAPKAKPLYEEQAAPADEKKKSEPQKAVGAGSGSGLTNKDLVGIALNEQKKIEQDYPNWKESTWDDWYNRIGKQFNLSENDIASLRTQRGGQKDWAAVAGAIPKKEKPKEKDWTGGAGAISKDGKKGQELKDLQQFTARQQALATGRMTKDAYAEQGAKVADDAYKRYKEQVTQQSIDNYLPQRKIVNDDPIKGYANYLKEANPARYQELTNKLLSGRWDKGANPEKVAELEAKLALAGPVTAGIVTSGYELLAEMLQFPNTEDSGKLYKEALAWKGETENAILKKLYADQEVKTYLQLNEEISNSPITQAVQELDKQFGQLAQTPQVKRYQELVAKGNEANGVLPNNEFQEYQQLTKTKEVQALQQVQQGYQQMMSTPEGAAYQQKTQQAEQLGRTQKVQQFFEVNQNADNTKALYEGYAKKYPQQAFEEAHLKAKKESTDALYKRMSPFLKTMADMYTSLMRVPSTVATEVAAGVMRPMAGAAEMLGAEQTALLWNDWSSAIVDLGKNLNESIFAQPTNLEVPMYDNYVPYMGARIYLNSRNEVVDVRDADGYALPEDRAARLSENYSLEENPPKPVNSWNTHMILPRITQTAADLLILAQAPVAGRAVGLGHSGSMVAYGYLTNYNAAYEEIKNADPFISEDAAHLYANTKGLVMGGLLTVTPQSIFKAGGNPQQAWKEIGKEYTRVLAGGATASTALKKALGTVMLRDGAVMGGIGLAMDLSDRGIKLASNTLTSRPTLDTEYKFNQAVESGLSMFVVGSIMAGFGQGFRGNRMRGDALYTGLKNYEKTIGEMEQMANRGDISQQDFTRANGILSQLKGVYDNLADMGKYNDAYKAQLIGLYAEKLRVEEKLSKAASNTALEIGYSPERVALQRQLDAINRDIERVAIVNNPEFLVFTKKAEVEGDARASEIIAKYVRGGGLTQAEVEYLASKTRVSKQYVIDPKTRRPMAVKEMVSKEPVEIEPGVEQMDVLGVRMAVPEYFLEGEMVTRDQLLEMIKDPVFLSDVLSGRKMLDIFNDIEIEALLDRYRPTPPGAGGAPRLGAGERMLGGRAASRPMLGPATLQSTGSRSIRPKRGGPAGVVEQTETGWFFTDDAGRSKQLPVRDKNNPVETLDELGYELVEDVQPAEQAVEGKIKVDISMKDDNVSFIIGGEEFTWLKFNFGNSGELQTADVITKDGKKHKIKNRDVVYDMAVMLSNNTSNRLGVPVERMAADIEQAVAPIKEGYDVGMRAIDNIFSNADPAVEEALALIEAGEDVPADIQKAAEAWLSDALDRTIKIETDNVQEKQNIVQWAGELWYDVSSAKPAAARQVQPGTPTERPGGGPVAEGEPSPAAKPREYEFPEVSTRARGQAKRLAGTKGEAEVERIFETVREAYKAEKSPTEALGEIGYFKPEYQKAVGEIIEALKPTIKESEVEMTTVGDTEVLRQMRPITDQMAFVERQFANKGYKIDTDYDNEIIVTDKKGEIVDVEDLPKQMQRLAGQYEGVVRQLGEYDARLMEQSLAKSRDAQDVEAIEVKPELPPAEVRWSASELSDKNPVEVMQALSQIAPELEPLMQEGIDIHDKLKEIKEEGGGNIVTGSELDRNKYQVVPTDLFPFPYRIYSQLVNSKQPGREEKAQDAIEDFKSKLKAAKEYLKEAPSVAQLAMMKAGAEKFQEEKVAKIKSEQEAARKRIEEKKKPISRSETEGERLSEYKEGDVVFRDYGGKYEEYRIVSDKGSIWKLENTQTGKLSDLNADNNGGFVLKSEETIAPELSEAYTFQKEQQKISNEINELKSILSAGKIDNRKIEQGERAYLERKLQALETKLADSLKGDNQDIESDAIKTWLGDSEYSDYISFEWDGNVLEVFMGRDEAPVELSREELIEEGVELMPVAAAAAPKTPALQVGKERAPLRFQYIRNPEKAPFMGSTYGQDVEPAGVYVNQIQQDFVPAGWETGIANLRNPLEIAVNANNLIEWKNELSQAYDGLTGQELTGALIGDGYDGIVTRLENGELGEIIIFNKAALSFVAKEQAAITPGEGPQYIGENPVGGTANVGEYRSEAKETIIAEGNTTKVILADGKTYDAVYTLSYLTPDGLLASHSPTKGFRKTEGFPVDEQGNTINNRDYQNDPTAQKSVMDISSRPNMSLYFDRGQSINTGPPTSTSDRYTIAGNGRKMAADAWSPEKQAEYEDMLRAEGEYFGFSPEAIESAIANANGRKVFMDRMLTNYDGNYSKAEFQRFNVSEGKEASEEDIAIGFASKLAQSPRAKELLFNDIGNYDTINEFFKNNRSAKLAKDIMLREGILLEKDINAFFDRDGDWTTTGRGKFKSGIFASLFDEDIVRLVDKEGVAGFIERINKALPAVARNLNFKPDVSLRNEIQDAIRLQFDFASSPFKNFDEFIRQLGMFDKPSPQAAILWSTISNSTVRDNKIRNALDSYNNSAESDTESLLFADMQLRTKQDFFDLVTKNIPENERKAIEISLAANGLDPGRPGELSEPGANYRPKQSGNDRLEGEYIANNEPRPQYGFIGRAGNAPSERKREASQVIGRGINGKDLFAFTRLYGMTPDGIVRFSLSERMGSIEQQVKDMHPELTIKRLPAMKDKYGRPKADRDVGRYVLELDGEFWNPMPWRDALFKESTGYTPTESLSVAKQKQLDIDAQKAADANYSPEMVQYRQGQFDFPAEEPARSYKIKGQESDVRFVSAREVLENEKKTTGNEVTRKLIEAKLGRPLKRGEYGVKTSKPALSTNFGMVDGKTKIKSPADVAYIARFMEDLSAENAFVFMIDQSNNPVLMHIGVGGVAATLINQQAVIDAVLAFGAKSFYVIHNHPSGNMEASKSDFRLNKDMADTAKAIGVDFSGSLIVDWDKGQFTMIDPVFNSYEYKGAEYAKPAGRTASVPIYHSLYNSRNDQINNIRITSGEAAMAYAGSALTALKSGEAPKGGVILLGQNSQVLGHLILNGANDIETITKGAGIFQANYFITWGTFPDPVIQLGTSIGSDITALDHVYVRSNNFGKYDLRAVAGEVEMVFPPAANDMPGAAEASMPYNEKSNKIQLAVQKSMVDGFLKFDEVMLNMYTEVFGGDVSKLRKNLDLIKEAYDELSLADDSWIDEVSPIDDVARFNIDKFVRGITSLQRRTDSLREQYNDFVSWFEYSFPDYVDYARIDIDPATGQAVIMIGDEMVKLKDGSPLYYATWLNNKDIQSEWNTKGREDFATRPPILWVDKDATPTPPNIVKADKYNIGEDQRVAVNLALNRFINQGKRGMMIGDGPGVGKTREELVIAKEMVEAKKKPAMIVTAANNIVEQFKLEAADLAFRGLSYRQDPKKDVESAIVVATYDDIVSGKVGNADSYSVVIFDEAHFLKNTTTTRSKQSRKFLDKADHVVFATGTPMDKMRQFLYFLEYMSDKPVFEALDEIGLEMRSDGIYLKKGANIGSIKQAFVNWRTNMIKEGGYVRREYPFFGNMSFLNLEMEPQDVGVIQAIADNERLTRRMKISEGNRYQEHLKAKFIFNQAMKDLSEGKQVVVFCVGINPTEIKSLGMQVNQFAKEFTDMLRASGIPFAEIYGPDATKKLEDARRFQRGEVKVAIATYGSGGTGIDLDDQFGDAPRVAYLATLPWSGTVLDQALYRISRRNTKTPSRLRIVKFSNSWVDEHKKDISDNRMMVLRNIQAGKDPDLIAINNWKEDIDGRIVDVEDMEMTDEGEAIDNLEPGDVEEFLKPIVVDEPLTREELNKGIENNDPEILEAIGAAPRSTQKTIEVSEVTQENKNDPQELESKKTQITSIGGSTTQPYKPSIRSRLKAMLLGPDKPKSLGVRVLETLKKLGVPTAGEYHMSSRTALGVYSQVTRDVRLKVAQDIFVAIHEAMHYGDFVVSNNLTSKILKKGGSVLFDELSEIADKFYAVKLQDVERIIAEGLTMYMQMSLYDPATVAKYSAVRKEVFTPGGQFYNPFFTKLFDEFNALKNEVAAMAPLAQVSMRMATPAPESEDYTIEGWGRIDESISKMYNEAHVLEKWDDAARIGFGTAMERVVQPGEMGEGTLLQSSMNAYLQFRKRNTLAAAWVSESSSLVSGMLKGKPVYYGTDGQWKIAKYRVDDIIKMLEKIEARNPNLLNDSVWTNNPVTKYHTPEIYKAYNTYLVARRLFMDYRKRDDAEFEMASIIQDGLDMYNDMELVQDPDLYQDMLDDFNKKYVKPLQKAFDRWSEVNSIIGNEGGSYKSPNPDFSASVKAWADPVSAQPSVSIYNPAAGDLVSENNVNAVYDKFKPEFEEVDAVFDYIMQKMLIQAVATGMVSPKQANKWMQDQKLYPGYAPFYRQATTTIFNDEDFQSIVNSDKSGKIRNTLRRMGSEKAIQDPLLSATIIIHENFRKGLRNLMWLRLANMAKTDPMLARGLTKLKTARQPIKKDGVTVGMKPVLVGKNPQIDNTVIIYSNGVPSFYGINDRGLINFYTAITELDGGQWWGGLVNSRIYKASRGAATMFTLMTTGAYVPFAIQNLSVDQFQTAINSRNGFIPLVSSAKHFLPAFGKAIGDLIHDQVAALWLYQKMFPGSMPNQAQISLLQQYISMGGVEMTLINTLRNPEVNDAMLELVDARPKGIIPKAKSILKKDVPKGVDLLIDLAALPVNLTEIATRFTEFKLATNRGMSLEAAMRYAEETVPFKKRGNWKFGRAYFPLVSYLKASIVVGGKNLETLRTRPKRFAAVWAGVASSVALILAYMWDELTEREKNDYRSADPNDLAMYFRFPARLMGGPDDVMWKLRIPEVAGAPYALGTMYAVALRDNTDMKSRDIVKAINATIPSVFSPYDWFAGDEQGVAPSIVRQGVRVAPNIVRGPLGVYSDKVMGREGTYPLTPRGLENLPIDQQFRIGKKPTAYVVTQLGAVLNESMNLGLSPIQIEYLLGEYLGRAGKQMLDLMDEREMRSVFATPFEIKGTQNKWQERFYDNLTRLRRDYQFIDSVRDIRPPENTPEFSKYLEKTRQTINDYAVYEAFGTMLTKLRDAEDIAGIKGKKMPLYIYDMYNNALRSLYEEKPMYESIEKIDEAFKAFRREAPALGYEDEAFFYNYDSYAERIAESQEVKYENKTESLFR